MSQIKTKSKTGANTKRVIEVYIPPPQNTYENAMSKTWACGGTCINKVKEGTNDDPNIPALEKSAIYRMKLSECKLQDCMPQIVNQLKLQIDDEHKQLKENTAALAAIKGRKEMHITYYRSLLKNTINVRKKKLRECELFLLKAGRNKAKPIDIVNMLML